MSRKCVVFSLARYFILFVYLFLARYFNGKFLYHLRVSVTNLHLSFPSQLLRRAVCGRILCSLAVGKIPDMDLGLTLKRTYWN